MSVSNKVAWHDECAEIVYRYRTMKKVDHTDAYRTVNKICEVLEKYGFIDSDWWAENERK